MFSKFLFSVTAVAALAGAQSFEGQGKINVVDNANTVGCLTEDGLFSVDTSTCATFTGYRNQTYYPEVGGYTSYWYLNTTEGYCGAPRRSTEGDWSYVFKCDSDIDKEKDAYWGLTNGVNSNIGLTLLDFGLIDFTSNFNTLTATKPTADEPTAIRPYIGDATYNPGGTQYVLTWTGL